MTTSFRWNQIKNALLEKMGIYRPIALSSKDWQIWHRTTKQNSPMAYWLFESFPTKIRDLYQLITHPFNFMSRYIKNRWFYKTHLMPTHLPKGEYYSIGDTIINGCFQQLIDFVEIECSQHHLMWAHEQQNKFNYPWWKSYTVGRWIPWRSSEAGVAYLYWCMSLDDPALEPYSQQGQQAESARTTFRLYYWWKYTRAQRDQQLYNTQINEFYQAMDKKYQQSNWMFATNLILNSDEQSEWKRLNALQSKMEIENDQQDDEMLITLISHRGHLWT